MVKSDLARVLVYQVATATEVAAMHEEKKPAPLELEIPVGWAVRPIIIRVSFWLAVVFAVLLSLVAAGYFGLF